MRSLIIAQGGGSHRRDQPNALRCDQRGTAARPELRILGARHGIRGLIKGDVVI